jgi:phosphate transport system permease protein
LVLIGGILLAVSLGPVTERLLFAGDLKPWLNHQIGKGWGGWFYLFLPLGVCLGFLFCANFMNSSFIRRHPRLQEFSQSKPALFDFGKFLVILLFGFLLALVLAHGISVFGLDPRGSVFGTYVQRNALIVGFVMGFAIIPIIYTLAEDALSMVPHHLRIASLGSGATLWQTTRWVVIPTAMSGLFSAVMIGLGRAVGETMIVLMAAGNTPVLEWNIFNGFRTLSANIAVELPEAVKDGTHYRILFLSGLILFLLTSILNTLAEVVRHRFRKRASHL